MHRVAQTTLPALLLLITSAVPVHAEFSPAVESRAGHFTLSYDTSLEPLTINRIHSWTIHVATADGSPVTGATLSISGGMPVHNHGLPTSPRMTRELGDGNYLFEGVRFHMNGAWELTVKIHAGSIRDVAVIPLTL